MLPILECHTLANGCPYFLRNTISILFSTASSIASVVKAVDVVINICSTFLADISCFCPSFFKQKHSPTLLKYTPSELTINFKFIPPFL